MSSRLNHVGIAVKDIGAAIEQFRLLCPDLHVGERIRVESQGSAVCFIEFPTDAGGAKVELVSPLREDSPIGKFIAKHGEGQHHICFTCENLDEKLESLRLAGIELIDETPRIGALGRKIAFLHPSSIFGTLVEFEEES